MFQFTEEHRTEGLALQSEVAEFETELKNAVEEIWALPVKEGEEDTVEGWAARMAEVEKRRAISSVERVPKPDVPKLFCVAVGCHRLQRTYIVVSCSAMIKMGKLIDLDKRSLNWKIYVAYRNCCTGISSKAILEPKQRK